MSDIDEANVYIRKIIDSIKRNNRFNIDSKFYDLLKKCFVGNKKTIRKGDILYRARIYSEDDRFEKYHNLKKSTWEGYDKENSFINIADKWNVEGRMNPAGIKYLYVATEVNTCLAEIKPYAHILVSVAEIRVNQDLYVVDFSRKFGKGDTEFLAEFSLYINQELGRGDIEPGGYLFSQIVAEYCKKNNFDGMVYNSAFNNFSSGNNVTIFSYEKCEAISSKLYYIDDITVGSHPIKSNV